jgi:GxGYxYP putative glycoside hydrolase C-terminal domain/GxGYxY sequence motif in domain of unknown function N-terminal
MMRRAQWMIALLLMLVGPRHALGDALERSRWFPEQAAPKALVRTIEENRFPEPRLANRMMVQSLAGLAAKAVNAGRGDELVWVGTDDADIEGWYKRLLERRTPPETRGVFAPWELVDRYREKGIIQGYILYRADRSRGEINGHRKGMDCSVNVATSLAGLLDGVIVEEGLEAEAKQHGLKLLLDVRDKSQEWCFRTYRDRFHRRLLCTQDPRKPNVRDLAVAQGALTLYGDGAPLAEALAWLEPPAPILGWNGGDEFEATRLSTIYGHFQTASDWCMNLPVLMAGSASLPPARVQSFDPRGIDWNDHRSAVSFILSDGDNVQWLEGDFFRNPSFWADPARGRMPFGWSSCFAHLSQLCPPAVDYAAATQTPRDGFLEWGGGYYYPDLFARERPDRWAVLARQAKRTWDLMQVNHIRVVAFNMSKTHSPDALKAYQVFAGETDGLLAILAFQYAPYEGGAGETFWVKDRKGVDVPVVTARYSIWGHTNQRPRSGTPAKVAREIRETVARAPADDPMRFDWVIVHAWSHFRKAPGLDENAENVPESRPQEAGTARGYTPATWCAERLPESVRVVHPEELLWRIRDKHNRAQTRKQIEVFHP